jgi:hypothetical protein
MKPILITLTCVFALLSSSFCPANAEEKINNAWVKNQAFKVAKKYAESIACETFVEKKNLIALSPWNSVDDDDRSYAKYALVWHGDIGCNSGSGTNTWNISIIQIGVGSHFFVDPAKSSPMIRVQLPIKPDIKIVRFSESTITIRTEISEISSDGNSCCDSIDVDLKLKVDKQGNWNVVNRKKL